MKKTIALVSIVLLMAWAGAVVSDTTFSWSNPASQNGTLQYTGLTLNTPTISNGVISASTATIATNVVTVMKVGSQTGWTGVITNKMSNYTNLTYVGAGIVTNMTLIGALP